MSEPRQVSFAPDIEGEWDHTMIDVPCNQECGATVNIEKYCIDLWGAVTCDECCGKAVTRNQMIEEAKVDRTYQIIPPIYQDFDGEKYPAESVESFQKVLAWQIGHRGMYVMGNTRKGKTRAIMELLKRLIKVNKVKDITTIWMGDLKDKIVDLSTEKKRTQYKWELKNTQLLVFDDIFNDSITESLMSFIFSVIDYRLNYKKPTIISSNLTGEKLRDLGGEKHRASALYNRIKESSEIVWFK